MNYRMEEKEAFRIVGLKKRVPLIYRGVNPEIARRRRMYSDSGTPARKENILLK